MNSKNEDLKLQNDLLVNENEEVKRRNMELNEEVKAKDAQLEEYQTSKLYHAYVLGIQRLENQLQQARLDRDEANKSAKEFKLTADKKNEDYETEKRKIWSDSQKHKSQVDKLKRKLEKANKSKVELEKTVRKNNIEITELKRMNQNLAEKHDKVVAKMSSEHEKIVADINTKHQKFLDDFNSNLNRGMLSRESSNQLNQ